MMLWLLLFSLGAGASSWQWVDKEPLSAVPQTSYFTDATAWLLSWRPLVDPAKSGDEDCVLPQATPRVWSETLQNQLKSCEKQWRKSEFNSSFWMNYKTFYFENSYWLDPRMRGIEFELKDGTKVRGMLGLQMTDEPRPLVIFRCGLFCNSSRALAEKFLIQHYFGDSDFHFLLIGSSTSAERVELNGEFRVDGIKDAEENLEILGILRAPKHELSKRFSTYHLAGVSHGGQGVLMAHALQKADGYKTFTAICPVVQLNETLQSLLQTDAEAYMTGVWFWYRLRKAAAFDPKLKSLFEKVHPWNVHQFAKRLSQDLPGLSKEPISTEEYWKRNNVLEVWGDPAKSLAKWPILLMGSSNDFLPVNLNFSQLRPYYSPLNPNLAMIEFPNAAHCALSLAYDWKLISNILQDFVRNQKGESVQ